MSVMKERKVLFIRPPQIDIAAAKRVVDTLRKFILHGISDIHKPSIPQMLRDLAHHTIVPEYLGVQIINERAVAVICPAVVWDQYVRVDPSRYQRLKLVFVQICAQRLIDV